jgi:hypothetical protein
MKKLSDSARIRNYLAKHPNAKPDDIAQALKVTLGLIYSVRRNEKKKADAAVTEEVVEAVREKFTPAPDPVNHPNHYTMGGIETVDFIEAKKLSFHLGNVVKYITRAEHKGNRKEDLLKAQWYLDREIKRIQE